MSFQVLIRGSGQIGRVLQLKVNLESGQSEVDTVPKDPRFRFESESDSDDMPPPEQKREIVSQYDMNREAIPTSLRYVYNKYINHKPDLPVHGFGKAPMTKTVILALRNSRLQTNK